MGESATPLVGIVMGSVSDMPAMEPCMKQLDEFGIAYEVKVASAHRKPLEVHAWAESAEARGLRRARRLTWAASLPRIRRCPSSRFP